MSSPITIQLDPEATVRLQGLAAARNRLPEAILREALAQYLDCEKTTSAAQPKGKTYPARHLVGGIITPV